MMTLDLTAFDANDSRDSLVNRFSKYLFSKTKQNKTNFDLIIIKLVIRYLLIWII